MAVGVRDGPGGDGGVLVAVAGGTIGSSATDSACIFPNIDDTCACCGLANMNKTAIVNDIVNPINHLVGGLINRLAPC